MNDLWRMIEAHAAESHLVYPLLFEQASSLFKKAVQRDLSNQPNLFDVMLENIRTNWLNIDSSGKRRILTVFILSLGFKFMQNNECRVVGFDTEESLKQLATELFTVLSSIYREYGLPKHS